MPITVAHQPGAAVVGQSAALGGAGEFARWWTNLVNSNKNQSLDRISRENMQKLSIQAQKQAQDDAQAHAKEMFKSNIQAQQDAAVSQQDNRLEQMEYGGALREDQMAQQQDQWEERFSTQQEAKIEQFNNYLSKIDEAEASGELKPEEATNLRLQVQGSLAGVKPGRFPKPKSEWPEGQSDGQIWKLEDGTLVTRSEGKITKVADAPKTPENDPNLKFKLDQQAMKVAMERLKMEKELRTATDFAGKRLYSDEDIDTKLDAVFGPVAPRSAAPQQGTAAGQGPAMPPPTTPSNPMEEIRQRASQNPELMVEFQKVVDESRSWTKSQISAVKHTLAGAPPGTDPITLLGAAMRAAELAK